MFTSSSDSDATPELLVAVNAILAGVNPYEDSPVGLGHTAAARIKLLRNVPTLTHTNCQKAKFVHPAANEAFVRPPAKPSAPPPPPPPPPPPSPPPVAEMVQTVEKIIFELVVLGTESDFNRLSFSAALLLAAGRDLGWLTYVDVELYDYSVYINQVLQQSRVRVRAVVGLPENKDSATSSQVLASLQVATSTQNDIQQAFFPLGKLQVASMDISPTYESDGINDGD